MTDTHTVAKATDAGGSSGVLASPGFVAILLLAVLTVVEYFLSAGDVPALGFLLAVIAIGKAAVIVASFMHLKNIFSEEHS